MPPPIQSKITLSAVAASFPALQLNEPSIGAPAAMAAIAAVLVVCKKFLLEMDLFIQSFVINCQLIN
jgi:hypothetical protein